MCAIMPIIFNGVFLKLAYGIKVLVLNMQQVKVHTHAYTHTVSSVDSCQTRTMQLQYSGCVEDLTSGSDMISCLILLAVLQ